MNDGVEGEAVPPAGGEVPDVDVVVSGGLHLAPEQQGVLRTLGLRTRVVGLNSDLLQVEKNQICVDLVTWNRSQAPRKTLTRPVSVV